MHVLRHCLLTKYTSKQNNIYFKLNSLFRVYFDFLKGGIFRPALGCCTLSKVVYSDQLLRAVHYPHYILLRYIVHKWVALTGLLRKECLWLFEMGQKYFKYFKTKEPLVNKSLGYCRAWIYKNIYLIMYFWVSDI